MSQEANNEVGAAGPSGDFEIRDDRRNELGRGILPADPDLMGNTVEGGSSAAQLPQKNILERKEVLIGVYLPVKVTLPHPDEPLWSSWCLPCSVPQTSCPLLWTHQDKLTCCCAFVTRRTSNPLLS